MIAPTLFPPSLVHSLLVSCVTFSPSHFFRMLIAPIRSCLIGASMLEAISVNRSSDFPAMDMCTKVQLIKGTDVRPAVLPNRRELLPHMSRSKAQTYGLPSFRTAASCFPIRPEQIFAGPGEPFSSFTPSTNLTDGFSGFGVTTASGRLQLVTSVFLARYTLKWASYLTIE
jgi:hypothetical protein